MKTVLVAGGAGYIGSHACKALTKAGYTPVVYDNLSQGHEDVVKWGPFEKGDIADRARLNEVIARHKPVAVMHFAAFIAVGESVADPAKYYRNNVAGTLTLLEAMKTGGVRHIVFSSTAAVYGEPEKVPLKEDLPLAPINPYGRSKLMVENMLADFDTAYGITHVAPRYFNACGADEDGETGEDHSPETHLIPLCIFAAEGKRDKLKLFGDDYPTNDGTCVRDYIHVADLANAHVAALEYLLAGGASVSVNLGNGRGYSVREIIESVGRVTGKPVPYDVAPRRAGDPPELVADPAKAHEKLGWKAEITDLDSIVKSAWIWHKQRHF